MQQLLRFTPIRPACSRATKEQLVEALRRSEARSINLATLFPLVFGALAISGEVGRRTITTTFLTAPSRMQSMLAKMLVYALWGALYGLAIMASLAVGVLIVSDAGQAIVEKTGYVPLPKK